MTTTSPPPSGSAPPTTPGSNGQLASVARGGALALAGSVIFAVSNFLLFFVIAKHYNPRVAGAFFTATAIFQILTRVAELGVSTGLIRTISTARVHRQMHRYRPVLQWALIPVAAVGLALMLAVYGMASPIAELLPADGTPAEVDIERSLITTFFQLLAPFLPIAALYQALVNATRSFSTMKPFVAIERIAKSAMQLLLVSIVAFMSDTFSTDLLVIAWALPILLSCIPTVFWFAKLYQKAHRGVAPEPVVDNAREQVRAFWSFTSARSVASIAQSVVQFIDIPLVALFVGVDEAGIYGVASRFLQVGTFASLSVSQVMQPKISEAFARKDQAGADELYKFSTAWLVLITAPIYLLVALFPEPLLEIFGPEYVSARGVLVILSMATLFGSFCGAADTVLIMGGSSRLSLMNLVVSAITNIGLNVLLLKVLGWGIEGAAVAWAVSILLQKLLPVSQVIRTMSLSPFGTASVIAGWTAMATVGVIALAARAMFPNTLLVAVAAGIAGAIMYAAVLSTRMQATGLDIALGSFSRSDKGRRTGKG